MIYTVFTMHDIRINLLQNAPNILPINTCRHPYKELIVAATFDFNDHFNVLKKTWLEVRPDAIYALSAGAPNNGGNNKIARSRFGRPPTPTRPDMNPPIPQ